ncbi:hypothetical protein [Peptoanaerobacter stomatis]|uniref:hypothetical protein n=1 Tax=Peptoanaerobacter stomatis TaxID=796937 RepID=UPI003F9F3F20
MLLNMEDKPRRKRALKRLLPFCSELNKNMVTRMNIQLDGMEKNEKSDIIGWTRN